MVTSGATAQAQLEPLDRIVIRGGGVYQVRRQAARRRQPQGRDDQGEGGDGDDLRPALNWVAVAQLKLDLQLALGAGRPAGLGQLGAVQWHAGLAVADHELAPLQVRPVHALDRGARPGLVGHFNESESS